MAKSYITERAKQALNINIKAVGALMIVFARGERTIKEYINEGAQCLTTPDAMAAIIEHTGLTPDEILKPAAVA